MQPYQIEYEDCDEEDMTDEELQQYPERTEDEVASEQGSESGDGTEVDDNESENVEDNENENVEDNERENISEKEALEEGSESGDDSDANEELGGGIRTRSQYREANQDINVRTARNCRNCH